MTHIKVTQKGIKKREILVLISDIKFVSPLEVGSELLFEQGALNVEESVQEIYNRILNASIVNNYNKDC